MCRKCHGAPQEVATDLLKSTSISWVASWKDGTAGFPDESYALKCVPRGSAGGCDAPYDTVDIERGIQEGEITGLQPDTEYDCYVIAVNEFGSKCSEKTEFRTLKCSCDLSSGTNNFASGFTTAQSINLQPGGNQGSTNTYDSYYPYWTIQDNFPSGSVGNWDEEIVEYESKNVWRVSNKIDGTGFSNQPFSPADSIQISGETNAYTWNNRGTDNTKPKYQTSDQQGQATSSCFCAGFDIRSVTGAAQEGLSIQVAPSAKQSSWRNSFLNIYDSGNGINLAFIDSSIKNSEKVSEKTVLPLELNYTNWHRITFLIEFVDGVIESGDDVFGNDIVKIFVDGLPVIQGTTWETSYRFGNNTGPPDQNSPPEPRAQAINSLLFALRCPAIKIYCDGPPQKCSVLDCESTTEFTGENGGFYISNVNLNNGFN